MTRTSYLGLTELEGSKPIEAHTLINSAGGAIMETVTYDSDGTVWAIPATIQGSHVGKYLN